MHRIKVINDDLGKPVPTANHKLNDCVNKFCKILLFTSFIGQPSFV